MDLEKPIQLLNLSKSYGPVDVLRNINLEFRPGEVHALLGANGAGKSTLLGCLGGAVWPTSGSISIDGVEHKGFEPRDALAAGISIIYQHFQLATTLSVSDNVFLGDERRTKWGALDRREQERLTSEVLAKIGLDLRPDETVESLSVGAQQGIEIARSVRREPRLLILDEPTAALGKHEVEALLKLVKRLAHQMRVAVIYVTHLLGEVMEVADHVSVLREGRVLWTKRRSEVSVAEIIRAISPEASGIDAAAPRRAKSTPLATFEAFTTGSCGPIDLSVGECEIVGVYGMLGCGRTDFLETAAGARGAWKGSLHLAGKTLRHASTAEALASGVGLIASDRAAQSLFATLSAQENLLMPNYSAFSAWWRRLGRERRVFETLASDLKLHPPDPVAIGSSFSGGNAQKIMLGRWLSGLRDIRLLLLDEPTQGVDVGSRAQIYGLLRRFTEGGEKRAVIFATSDPEEAVSLADRIMVLVNGQVRQIVSSSVGEAELISLAQSVEIRHGMGH